GGLKEELMKVREMIELPLKHAELFERLGIDPPKGVLLYGPPGTGKTLIAKAVANEAGANFYSIQGPEIMSKYYGQSEERLREKFEEAQKNAPSVLFIDELDSIAPKREEVTGEVEMKTLRRYLPDIDLDKPIPAETLEKMRVLADDFKQALKEIEPSAMREVLVEVPRVNWSDVGGLEDVKMKLREAVEMPLKDPEAFKRMGIRRPRGRL